MRVALAVVVVCAAGCPSGRLAPQHDVLPPPHVSAVGGAGLDVGAWNLHNFPCGNASGSTTCRAGEDAEPAFVASLMGALAVDLMSVEEIDDEDAFHAVVDALPHHTGVLSSHTYFDGTYQKVGFVYDADRLVAGNERL